MNVAMKWMKGRTSGVFGSPGLVIRAVTFCLALLLTQGSALAADPAASVQVTKEAAADSGSMFSRANDVEKRFFSLQGGNSYYPGNRIGFALASFTALYDFGRLWNGRPGGAADFKVESSVGTLVAPETRFMASLEFLKVKYIDQLATASLKPYVEAGIGVAYTDYQQHGQGLRFNFNPQLGLGLQLDDRRGSTIIGLRYHHLSNGELHEENRGINSFVVQVGRSF